ncbi:MAG: protein kinase [Terriglobus roseus]|nr:protein kinase [Terriglobus roseus]
MSSAAVQASTPANLPSPRQYSQQQQYYQQQQQSQPQQTQSTQSPSLSASSQSRRQRSASGNGHSPHTPQQPAHPSPGDASASSLTPRAQQPATVSPLMNSSSANPSGPPISPPQRTSSQQQRNMTATAGPGLDQQMGQLSMDPQQGGQSRRRQQAQQHASPGGTRASSSGKAPLPHSRSQNAVGETPIGTELPREQSSVINRIVTSDPQEDVAREKERMKEAHGMAATGLGLVGSEGVDDASRGATVASAPATAGASSSKTKDGKPRKEMKFGDYVLGQTVGEGEFGKVKMGWKRDGGVQVAIKLIRKETLGIVPNRLPKIYREINILRNLQHPNIVRLHEMVETQRHIGIILEYASGGELFDYILNHRYLKDQAARRLFAQLVSGVGYLHKRGIVHRDLKLENLLLDRNRNIIITDFGFANTFNPKDELGEETEYRLGDKEFIRTAGLDRQDTEGHRRGDLMQTSCGSPCYAAPELVVSDTLYTGRKVDVWSCGVILYAMLAGYLPFDDDPANPEGDNINLLYKYIVSTPLTFPEYVTPHARDLLKRILVPDPRKRADLFEVARHSWLGEYFSVVEFITSSTTDPSEVQNAPQVNSESPKPESANEILTIVDEAEAGPRLGRSASVREPTKSHAPAAYTSQRSQPQEAAPAPNVGARDTKRRTVQVEYIAPQQSTARGDAYADPQNSASASRSRARPENQGPVEVAPTAGSNAYRNSSQQAPTQQANMSAPTRPNRESQRAISDSTAFSAGNGQQPITATSRPATGGSMTAGNRLPSRGNSYGQPAAATVAATNAAGQFSQPQGRQYTIANPLQQQQQPDADADANDFGRLSTQRPPVKLYEGADPRYQPQSRGHKRSSTLGGLIDKTLGRTGSLRGGRPSMDQGPRDDKLKKSYPPTSMRKPVPNDDSGRRMSTESSRRSFSFGRKNTNDSAITSTAAGPDKRSSRRFSLLNAFRSKSNDGPAPSPQIYTSDPRTSSMGPPPSQGGQSAYRTSTSQRPGLAFGQGESRTVSQDTTATGSTIPALGFDASLDRRRGVPSNFAPQSRDGMPVSQSTPNMQYPTATTAASYGADEQYYRTASGNQMRPGTGSASLQQSQQAQQQQQSLGGYQKPLPFTPQYPSGFDPDEDDDENEQDRRAGGQSGNRLQKPHRRFGDAYEDEKDHSGSSSAARKVADFFRRRGKNRDSAF